MNPPGTQFSDFVMKKNALKIFVVEFDVNRAEGEVVKDATFDP